MDSRVRDLFYIETREKIEIAEFEKVYSVFEQLIQYDIDVPELEGLGERLEYSLTKIATEKNDRNDIITLFPIIWGKFETYARTVLYLVDRKEYGKLTKDDSVINVLDKLGINVFVPRAKRTEKTEAVYKTYQVRNLDAHKCEKWSIKKFYEILSYVLGAYLIVTESSYHQLIKSINDKGIEILADGELSIGGIDIYDRKYSAFDNLRVVLGDIISITYNGEIAEFDDKGLLIRKESKMSEEAIFISEANYEFERELPIKQFRTTKRYNKGKLYETTEEIRIYSYDFKDRLSQIEIVEEGQGEDEKRTISIEYLTNGDVAITNMTVKSPGPFSEKQNVRTTRHIYNQKGELLSIENGQGKLIAEYKYEAGSLKEITRIRENLIVDHIGDNVIKRWRDLGDNEYHVREKEHYQDGRLVKIIYFKEDGKRAHELKIDYKK